MVVGNGGTVQVYIIIVRETAASLTPGYIIIARETVGSRGDAAIA